MNSESLRTCRVDVLLNQPPIEEISITLTHSVTAPPRLHTLTHTTPDCTDCELNPDPNRALLVLAVCRDTSGECVSRNDLIRYEREQARIDATSAVCCTAGDGWCYRLPGGGR